MSYFRWASVSSAAVLGLQLLGACKGKTTSKPDEAAAASSAGGAASHGSGGTANGGGSTSVDLGSATDLDSFLEDEGKGYCTRLFRCNEGNDDFLSERLVLEDAKTCEELLARVNASSRSLRDLRAQIAAGNLHYVPERGQKCLKDLSECNGTSSLSDGACREAFDGNAQTGEDCQRSEDCAGDAYCDSNGTCPGQCQPRKKAGETCEFDDECADAGGYVDCDHGAASPVCRALELAAKAGPGEPCTRNLDGATSVILCRDDLWCQTLPGGDSRSDVLGSCAMPLTVGGPCVDTDDVCSGSMCNTATSTCEAITLRKKAGDTCDKAAGIACNPVLGLHCNSAGTCDASGDGSEGSACFSSDLQWGCDAGLYCAQAAQATTDTPGTCKKLLVDAEACDNDASCAGGNCTDGLCGGRFCN